MMVEHIELERAQCILKDVVLHLREEAIPIMDAMNRVISKDVMAKHCQPPFDRSPLDGYAIYGEDTLDIKPQQPVRLQVVDEAYAGRPSKRKLLRGEAIRIMTGAVIPQGANAVIRQEDTTDIGGYVQIHQPVMPNTNICYAGEDYLEDQLLIEKGQLLNAYHIGVLASAGYEKVWVICKPKIGILSTGDELIQPIENLSYGKIYNSNQYTIGARLKALGCQLICLTCYGDDMSKVVNVIKENSHKFDALVTTGGVSVGKKDIIHDVIKRLGAEQLFWRINIKPGSPAMASKYRGKLMLSLSGNPSAASITFELLFSQWLGHKLGCQALGYKKLRSTFCGEYNKPSNTRRFLRAIHDQGKVRLPKGNLSSGALLSMTQVNGLIDIEAGSLGLKHGQEVTILTW
ncbi:molybdopterin molybdotransferase MoeA [Vallitalea pronyensis]|uniref:Molybdopterin molybdenumtransferase n=1 Tax=Vallitalea pronyensis TaxID=1348613 RepID=A0A8J8SIH8_9FIRM|nr:molybdopterin molybdotransferase MoeA [Vallitalea pronyensis]QUI24523.1 molybdopterin molybdotransferase MoeA [Vallitalea pronyensis]